MQFTDDEQRKTMNKTGKKSAKRSVLKKKVARTKARRVSAKAVKTIIRKGAVKHTTVRDLPGALEAAINTPGAVIVVSDASDAAAETTVSDVAVNADEIVTPA